MKKKSPRKVSNKHLRVKISVGVNGGRQHKRMIGGQMFYWNARLFSPENASRVAELLMAQHQRLKAKGSRDWDDPNFRNRLKTEIEQELRVGVHEVRISEPIDALSPKSRQRFDQSADVLLDESTQLDDLVSIFIHDKLERLDGNPNKAKKIRSSKARLGFVLRKHRHIRLEELCSAKTIERLAKEINGRCHPKTKVPYLYNYRRDIFKELRELLDFFSEHDLLDRSIRPVHSKNTIRFLHPEKMNTQESLKRQRPLADDFEKSKSEIKTLISKSRGPMRAFLLLALNCGYLTSEIGGLKNSVYDEKRGRFDWHRPKSINTSTNPPRFIHYLWPATKQAIEDSRNKDRSPEALIFVNKRGNGVSQNDWVGKQFRSFASSLGLTIRFSMIRKVSATLISAVSKDTQLASIHLGHQRQSVADKYYLRDEARYEALKRATDKIPHEIGLPELLNG